MYVNANCAGCGLCIDECNFSAISVIDGKAVINEELCINCGFCAAICPFDAIEYGGQENTPPDSEVNKSQAATTSPGNPGKRFIHNADSIQYTPELNNRVVQKDSFMERRRAGSFGKGLGRGQGMGSGKGRGSGNGKGTGAGRGKNR